MNREENKEPKRRAGNPALRAMLEDAGIVIQEGEESGEKASSSKNSGPVTRRVSTAPTRPSTLASTEKGAAKTTERRSHRSSLAPSTRDSVQGKKSPLSSEGRKSAASRTSRVPLEKSGRTSSLPRAAGGSKRGSATSRAADSETRASERPSLARMSRAPLEKRARASSLPAKKRESLAPKKRESLAPKKRESLARTKVDSIPPDYENPRPSSLPPPDPQHRGASIPPPVPRRSKPPTATTAEMFPAAGADTGAEMQGQASRPSASASNDASIDALFQAVATRDGAGRKAGESGSFFDTYGFAATSASVDETSAEHGPFDDMEDLDGSVPSLRRRGKVFYALIAGGVLLVAGGVAAALFIFDAAPADADEGAPPLKQASLAPSVGGDDGIRPFSGTPSSPTPTPPAPAAVADPSATANTAKEPESAGESAATTDSSPVSDEVKEAETKEAETKEAETTAQESTSEETPPSPRRADDSSGKSASSGSRYMRSARQRDSSAGGSASEKEAVPAGKKSQLASILDGSDSSMRDVGIVRSRDSVRKGFQKVARIAKRCSRTEKRMVVVSVTIAPSGRVTKAVPTGDFQHTEVGWCVAAAARSAKFPPSMKEMTVQYPLHP